MIIGGEIFDDTPIASGESVDHAYGLYLKDQTGTVHLEGLWIHGRGIGQAVVMQEGNGATVQIQRSRLESLHPVGDVHTDGIQSWAGPAVFRLYDVSIRSNALNLQMQPREYGYAGSIAWALENVNMEQLTDDSWALNKSASGKPWWPVAQKNVWLKLNSSGSQYGTNWQNGTKSGWQPAGASGGELVTGDQLQMGTPGDFAPASSVGTNYTP